MSLTFGALKPETDPGSHDGFKFRPIRIRKRTNQEKRTADAAAAAATGPVVFRSLIGPLLTT
ncbi:hypothetical protein T265_12413 [Opisthorchis viverrini]|uniref:Uncharacterized protein n=1 Tax=Opisthorchis viverrini TaxID=6198 RepID=A0A074YT51_OPIVI|nr:hypothetical protein T265_12413 [Opisthorchis viverrini]KER17976.1 hypothetical protein T265_12413 [Opisthorchis viverrini]